MPWPEDQMSQGTKPPVSEGQQARKRQLAAAKKQTPERKYHAFALEYVSNGLNASAAAVKVGYAPGYSTTLLAMPQVQLDIQNAFKRRAAKLDISPEHVVDEIARLAFASVGDVVSWDVNGKVTVKDSDSLSPEVLAAVSEVSNTAGKDGDSLKVKMHDKLAALNTLAKHMGLLREKIEIESHLKVDVHLYDGYSMAQLERMAAALEVGGGNVPAIVEGESREITEGEGTPPHTLSEEQGVG